jgi:N-acetylglucosaminyldiphosphoundecaprenol N-acetyl-beta-D-mannosaminyltransferase
MLTKQHPDPPQINSGAAFILADGAPFVWASRCGGHPLKERVAGSDIKFELRAQSPVRGYPLFFLGGPKKRRDGFAPDTLGSRSSAPNTRRSAS